MRARPRPWVYQYGPPCNGLPPAHTLPVDYGMKQRGGAVEAVPVAAAAQTALDDLMAAMSAISPERAAVEAMLDALLSGEERALVTVRAVEKYRAVLGVQRPLTLFGLSRQLLPKLRAAAAVRGLRMEFRFEAVRGNEAGK
ncbi:MAG: hypothetical protein ACI4RT_06830 [Candidatus Spyradenecus sp.]